MAEMTPPSMMPTRGTSRVERDGTRRMIARKIAVPARAKAAAMPILPISGRAGRKTVATRMPAVADSTVPAVEGSTKRLRTISCMISPATAMARPESSTAAVRGRRETVRMCQASASPERTAEKLTLVTPTNMETTARIRMAATPSHRAVRELRNRENSREVMQWSSG